MSPLLLLLACSPGEEVSVGAAVEAGFRPLATLGARPTAWAPSPEGLVVASTAGLHEWSEARGFRPLSWDLPEGTVTFLDRLPSGTWLLEIDGQGFYRHDGLALEPVAVPPDSALLRSLNPRKAPVALDLATREDRPEEAVLAALGGLYRTADDGRSWAAVATSGAGFNLLFTAVAWEGERLAATALRPAGLLPESFAGLLSAGVLLSEDDGATWQDADPELRTRAPVDVAFDAQGRLVLATLDRGLLRREEGAWVELGGPADPLSLQVEGETLRVGTSLQGFWALLDGRWRRNAGARPTLGMRGGLGLDEAGVLWAAGPGDSLPPSPGGATVHIALSMHVNLYHSYRGDANTDDGYGIDLDVMRKSLSWLDAHPALRADWDFDNAWSTDSDWMRVDGADVLAAVQRRVAAGLDDVRLMSWNNGAMVGHDGPDFDESIARAWASNQDAFGRVVPGVQPQECMFTPGHVPAYAAQGVEWITLFNSATPFSALRSEVELPREAWTRPSRIEAGGARLELVPVYHHGDLLDHGGLLGWARKLHEAYAEDQLLVIHFDADAESWESFDQELTELLDEEWVRFTTIQAFLDATEEGPQVPTPMDVADGNGDGLSSWAEKDGNHRLFTEVLAGRRAARLAEALAGADAEVQALLAQAVEPRLRALSTTNYGLAAPLLHPDRIASSWAQAGEARAASEAALERALLAFPVPEGEIEVWEPTGPAGLVRVVVPKVEEGACLLDEEGRALPFADVDGGASVVLSLAAGQPRRLRWAACEAPATAEPDLDLLDLAALQPPFTECDGQRAEGVLLDAGEVSLDGPLAERVERWSLPFCDGVGEVERRLLVQAGRPGVEIEVRAVMGQPSDPLLAESVALSPLACPGLASSLRWQPFEGAPLERPVRAGVRGWNGQAIDGWAALTCADGAVIALSHDAGLRSSLGLLPIRTTGGQTLLAPLGALWGPAPIVDVRRTGGLGVAWHGSEAIGSQFRPQAPDWAGQEIRYRLLVGDDGLDEGTLALFARPPRVR